MRRLSCPGPQTGPRLANHTHAPEFTKTSLCAVHLYKTSCSADSMHLTVLEAFSKLLHFAIQSPRSQLL